ncbi:MAG: phage holin family protein [Bacteroidia bacterium]|nr:phage holin family protein [Bacteroidia bacterium]
MSRRKDFYPPQALDGQDQLYLENYEQNGHSETPVKYRPETPGPQSRAVSKEREEEVSGLALGIRRVLRFPTLFFKTQVSHVKEKLDDVKSDLIQQAIVFGIIGISALLAIFFLSLTLGAFLNAVLDNAYLGYGICGSFLFVGGLGCIWHKGC